MAQIEETPNITFGNTGSNLTMDGTGGLTIGTIGSSNLYTTVSSYDYTNKMNIFKKLNDVMNDLGWVEKDGTVTIGQSYKYASESAFIAAVRPLFVQYGLVFYPAEIINHNVIEYNNNKGNKTFLTTIGVRYIFGDVDSGQTIEVEVMAQGSDNGDKGVYKALTGAFKYALRQTLMIGTGDDPEGTDDDGYRTDREDNRKISNDRKPPRGGDYPTTPKAESTPQPTDQKGSDYYKEQLLKIFAEIQSNEVNAALEDRNINLNNLPKGTKRLRGLYETAREIKGGKDVIEAFEDLDKRMG